MELYNYLISDKNIYLAIYSLKSYVNFNMLSEEDVNLYKELLDPFNEDVIFRVIDNVRDIIKKIMEEKNAFFHVQVYFKPKSYENSKKIFRPIHTTDIKQLIAMVSMLQVLIYEIPNEQNNYELILSNYSRLIPSNFYGNIVSPKPEKLYKDWGNQYLKFVEDTNNCFEESYKYGNYQYEVKLDIINFFPSVDPLYIIQYMLDNKPAIIRNDKDISILKTVIYKLLVCEIDNLKNNNSRKIYYNNLGSSSRNYTKGIPQGLPQSCFFGNICMIEISNAISSIFNGKAFFYVDDCYVYTNVNIENEENFISLIDKINDKIEEIQKQTVINFTENIDIFSFVFEENISNYIFNGQFYSDHNIKIHQNGKSQYTEIKQCSQKDFYLKKINRQVSQVGSDFNKIYSENEEEILLQDLESLVSIIKNGLDSIKVTGKEDRKIIANYKFFKFKMLKLKLHQSTCTKKEILQILLGEHLQYNDLSYKNLKESDIDESEFFDKYKNDIWEKAINLLISNTIYEHIEIKTYINNIIKKIYGNDLKDCSYIKKIFERYLKSENNCNINIQNVDEYYTLNYKVNTLLNYYSNLNMHNLSQIFSGSCIQGLRKNILDSFGLCTKRFNDLSKIVQNNTNKLQRMFLNAIYSKIFKIDVSNRFILSSYDKMGITYGMLRILIYLRNPRCNIKKFLNWSIDIFSNENAEIIDYSIVEVLDIFRLYVINPDYIDCLILTHKYTSNIWKNGSKHLYFYTLHNQEHAVELIRNIVIMSKAFTCLGVSKYNYYILFVSCYLHDISMVKIANEKDFLKNKKILQDTIDILKNWKEENKSMADLVFNIYKNIDESFENSIRTGHAIDSAKEIRRRIDLSFIEPSVRENVAQIAQAHGDDVKTIYASNYNKKSIINYTSDKILLRLADLLDMCQNRVSKMILNHNLNNISSKSAFHWISHYITRNYDVSIIYRDNNEKENNACFDRIVRFTVSVDFSQYSNTPSLNCAYGKLDDNTLNEQGFIISMLGDKQKCCSKNCNFLCRWFNKKNYYLIKELYALQGYLSQRNDNNDIYKTKIEIQVSIAKSTGISDEEFQILKNEVL